MNDETLLSHKKRKRDAVATGAFYLTKTQADKMVFWNCLIITHNRGVKINPKHHGGTTVLGSFCKAMLRIE